MRRQLRGHGSAIGWIITFAVLSTIVGSYIVTKQRLRHPFQERYEVRIAFARATSLTPGFGQPLLVSGVKVGTIDAVDLERGTALVTARVDPDELPAVYRDAKAVFLSTKDAVELDPGTAASGELEDAVIPIAQTRVPQDLDDLTTALDADTREYMRTLIHMAGVGVRSRGPDLRQLARLLRPTLGQVKRINATLAARDREMAHVVRALNRLSSSFSLERDALRRLTRDSSTTVRATARNDRALQDGLQQLPSTLQAARAALESGHVVASQLVPTLASLTSSTRHTPAALDASQPVLDATIPLLRDEIRPLTRVSQPIARKVRPVVRRTTNLLPTLTRLAATTRYLVNEVVHDPGKERGYLFWLAWLAHNGASVLSSRDAHGPIVRGLTLFSCDTVAGQEQTADLLKLLSTVARSACPSGD